MNNVLPYLPTKLWWTHNCVALMWPTPCQRSRLLRSRTITSQSFTPNFCDATHKLLRSLPFRFVFSLLFRIVLYQDSFCATLSFQFLFSDISFSELSCFKWFLLRLAIFSDVSFTELSFCQLFPFQNSPFSEFPFTKWSFSELSLSFFRYQHVAYQSWDSLR